MFSTLLPWLIGCSTPTDQPMLLHCSEIGAIAPGGSGLERHAGPCVERRADGYPVEGQVLARDGDTLTVDHAPIEGFMDAMVMDFTLPAGEPVPVSPGDRLRAHLIPHDGRLWLVDLQRTARGALALRADLPPLAVGDLWSGIRGIAPDGQTVHVRERVALSFLYTRCPNPAFCPALVSRLLPLQDALPPQARIVTVTLDPEHDTPAVLGAYGGRIGADPDRWLLLQTDADALTELALLAGQMVVRESNAIRHAHRLLVFGPDGRLVERYDHDRWPLQRVTRQLASGEPRGLHPLPPPAADEPDAAPSAQRAP